MTGTPPEASASYFFFHYRRPELIPSEGMRLTAGLRRL